MKYRELGKTGLQVSVLSYGASTFGGAFGPVDEAEAIHTLHTALDLGINFIDVSPYYGITKAETVLGKALAGVPRDRYFLATKVGRYDTEKFDFSAARVTASVDESLSRLGVDYVDLIQCHDIEFGSLDQVVNETLPALRRVREQGKARFIGITGLPLNVFRYVLHRTPVDTILSYCRYELNDTSFEELLPFLEQKQVGIINASPLGMGLLTVHGPPDWHPASPELKQAAARAAAYCSSKGQDIAQLALQFALANPNMDTTLVSMKDRHRLEMNIRCVEEPINEELLAQVLAIFAPVHNQSWPSGRPENAELT